MQGSRCAIVWEAAQDLVWELCSSPKSEKSTQVGVSLPLHAPGMMNAVWLQRKHALPWLHSVCGLKSCRFVLGLQKTERLLDLPDVKTCVWKIISLASTHC